MGKAHHILSKGIHKKICDYKVQLFWTLKCFFLILTEHSKNKVIRCFGVQQRHTLHQLNTTRTESRNSWWRIAWCFWHFFNTCVQLMLNWSTSDSISFSRQPKLCNNFILRMLYCCLISCVYGYFTTNAADFRD